MEKEMPVYRLMMTLTVTLLLATGSLTSAQPAPECWDFSINIGPDMQIQTYIDIAEEDDCARRIGEDHVYRLTVSGSGLYTFEDDEDATYLYLTTECCGGETIARNYGYLECIALDQGVYYLLVEEGEDVDYELDISACSDPCDEIAESLPEGESSDGEVIRWVHTVDGSSSAPYYEGPWQSNFSCQDASVNPDAGTYGFDYYSWYNQDFDWDHDTAFVSLGCNGDFLIDSAFVVICAWDVDWCPLEAVADYSADCEWDRIYVNTDPVYPYEIRGSNQSRSVTWFHVPLELLNDFNNVGLIDVNLDIDTFSDQCTWATTLDWSKLVVYGHCRSIPTPVGYDLGDLGTNEEPEAEECSYETFSMENGGPANAVWAEGDGVAWLGSCKTAEAVPAINDQDACDDGVEFLVPEGDDGWQPCDQVCVDVTVTLGPNYQGQPLYLWAWKDGNLDCDFEDWFCEVPLDDTFVFGPTECIIQGFPMTAGVNRLCFTDPGVLEYGVYDGYFRFRLLSVGPGLPGQDIVGLDCSSAQDFIDFELGETEDYIITDLQLPVELMEFTATSQNGKVRLNWTTASELNNDHFELSRRSAGSDWQSLGVRIEGAGNSTSNRAYGYVDEDVTIGQTYEYRLISVDYNGTRIVVFEVSAAVNAGAAQVDEYKLHANYPNPFNPSTTIAYDLRDATKVKLSVFDVLGREVRTLVNNYQPAGRYSLNFEANSLPSGVYFYRLETEQFTDMKKMMLLK